MMFEAIRNSPIRFLWTFSGRVDLPDAVTNDAALERVGQILDQQQKPYEFVAQGVEFDDPLWAQPLGGKWRTLVIFDRGRIWIEQQATRRILRYEIRSLHGFAFCLSGAMIFAAFGFFGEGIIGLRFGVALFLWLYGMYLALAAVRVPLLFGQVTSS